MVAHTDASVPGFVRLATAADASAIADIQQAAWRDSFGSSWPAEFFSNLAASDLELQWARAVIAPPGPGHRVFVATQGDDVVGYCALAPSDDPDADGSDLSIVGWEILPAARGAGHGSRLLAAAADHGREVRAQALSTWVIAGDDARQGLLRAAGFEPDGAHRELALDEGWSSTSLALRQIRFAAGL